MIGIIARDDAPRQSGLIGTSRQPNGRKPSSVMIFSTVATAVAARAGSAGKNTKPAAYAPATGSEKSTTARKKASGT